MAGPDVRRLWVRGPNWVGDMVMAMPLLAALRKGFPQARIALGTRPPLSAIPEGSGVFDDYIPVGRDLRADARRIRQGGFDAAVILPRSLRTALETRLAGIPRRIGFPGNGRAWLLTDAVPFPWREPACNVDVYLALAGTLGIREPDRTIRLAETPPGREGAERLLAPDGKRLPRPLFLFVPGAAFGSSKCWPERHFIALGRRLRERFGGTILVSGGPGEDAASRGIAEGIGHSARAVPAGDAPLPVLKSLVARADFVVTNDTGPRHIAAALGVPGVVLAGPMDPRYGESGQGRLVVLREEVPCGPCNLARCPVDHRCLERLSPERVLAVAAAVFG